MIEGTSVLGWDNLLMDECIAMRSGLSLLPHLGKLLLHSRCFVLQLSHLPLRLPCSMCVCVCVCVCVCARALARTRVGGF